MVRAPDMGIHRCLPVREVTRPVRLAVTVMDGPYAGRTLLVGNPVPPKLTLPLQGGSTVDYRIEKRGNAYLAFRGGAPALADRDIPRIGWRMWNLVQKDPITVEGEVMIAGELALTSVNGEEWPNTGPLVAACSPGGTAFMVTVAQMGDVAIAETHRAPQESCTCGIYAARTFDWLEGQSYARQVFGLVSGWGRTVQHEQGWRFERAYPLALVIDQYAYADEAGPRESHPLMGDVLTDAPAGAPVEAEAMRLAKVLARTYRVPVAVGSVDSATEMVTRILQLGKVPEWVYTALPPDLAGVTKR